MNNKLPVAVIEHLVQVCHIYSANKQLFGVGKVSAISALDEELRHQQMIQNNVIQGKFCPFQG